MDQIVQAINNLHSRDWVEYLAIFAPFVLSVVAVWVSISTARKQNNLALFDKRFEVYFELQKSISFDKGINSTNSNMGTFTNMQNEVRFNFGLAFCDISASPITTDITYEAYQCIIMEYRKTRNILSQGEFVFDFDVKNEIEELKTTLIKLLTSDDTKLSQAKADYHVLINNLTENTIPQIENVLRIK